MTNTQVVVWRCCVGRGVVLTVNVCSPQQQCNPAYVVCLHLCHFGSLGSCNCAGLVSKASALFGMSNSYVCLT